MALFLGASVLNHSCLPNAGFSFDTGEIRIRALENIQFGEGNRPEEAVTISYMSLMDSAENRCYVRYDGSTSISKRRSYCCRQRRLRERYYFTCRCRRCTNPNLDWPLYSMRCPTPTCLGKPVFVGATSNLDELTPKPCAECGKTPSKGVRVRHYNYKETKKVPILAAFKDVPAHLPRL